MGIQVSPMHDVGVWPRLHGRADPEKVGVLILGMQNNEWRDDNVRMRAKVEIIL